MTLRMLASAERDGDGDLVWTKTQRALAGGTTTSEVNVSRLLRPGVRKIGDVEHLLLEAQLHADGEGGANPARPVDGATAKRAIERIEAEGLTPAWRTVDDQEGRY